MNVECDVDLGVSMDSCCLGMWSCGSNVLSELMMPFSDGKGYAVNKRVILVEFEIERVHHLPTDQGLYALSLSFTGLDKRIHEVRRKLEVFSYVYEGMSIPR